MKSIVHICENREVKLARREPGDRSYRYVRWRNVRATLAASTPTHCSLGLSGEEIRSGLPGPSIVGAMACPRPGVGWSPCGGTRVWWQSPLYRIRQPALAKADAYRGHPCGRPWGVVIARLHEIIGRQYLIRRPHMNSCNRGHIISLEDGYSLYLLNESGLAPTPKARSFELPDDHVQYAPDRPADVKHVKLVITLDFEQETVSGTVYTTFSTLYDDLK